MSTNEEPDLFRYMRRPYHCWFDEEPQPCVTCGKVGGAYGFVNYPEKCWEEGAPQGGYVCETCLTTGRLAEKNLRVNEADVRNLWVQLAEAHPELRPAEREALMTQRTTEVEQRTPRPEIYNEFTWPAHCGDYLVYLQPVKAADLEPLLPDGDGVACLIEHLHEEHRDIDYDGIEWCWQEGLNGFYRFYLWQCRQCGKYQLTFDSD